MQVKSVKPILKQLQQSIQTITQMPINPDEGKLISNHDDPHVAVAKNNENLRETGGIINPLLFT